MRVELRLEAEPGQCFAPHAFDKLVGSTVPVKFGQADGITIGEGTVVAARVVDDGAAAILTVDTVEVL